MKPDTQKGFTLVELAIALMVIGLLIGGVLKGQELIENAKITSVIRQIKAYDAAALIFRNTYGALPGDIKRPNRIPNCTTDLCLTAGNGNGKLRADDVSQYNAELYNFFPHLTKAGMIQGPEGSTIANAEVVEQADENYPSTALDHYIGVMSETAFFNGDPQGTPFEANHYQLPAMSAPANSSPIIPVRTMMQIDTKLDDGRPHSGDVQIYWYGDCPSVGYLEGSNANEYAADDTSNAGGCPIVIRAGF